ncbi:putative bifunctional diguanylate cyclase/phosphodiesterase [Halofilum ochraceum]|uniref:putative bifunctional diguanylate cyclase/phosphodiesterase n=1 Tax=Halofilum ochraceum TaxID=1611323 RepID=UPI0008DA7C3F|nr:bifunctional diguanylate cyclase/phosphodiesterase [Halofilum ochraceum]
MAQGSDSHGGGSGVGLEALDRQIFERHALVMLLIDPASGQLLDANDAAAAFYGYPRSVLRSMNIDRINTLTSHEIRAEMARARRRDVATFQFRHRLANGEERSVEVCSAPVELDGREVLHSVIRDTSERERLVAEVTQHAWYDGLTGLPNRALFRSRIDEVLERAQRHGGRAVVMHLDLDRFRDLNEVWGHEHGDAILCQAAAAIEVALPGAEVIARLAADEFGIAAVESALGPDASDLAERVRTAFHTVRFRVGDRSVRLYTSIGVAVCPDDDRDPATLMRHAEAALIQAKRDGGDQWALYNPALSGRASERVLLGGDLREAIESGGLRLALQPVVDMRDGSRIGAEALVRWHHPEHGWIAPDRFIPVAEATGQIATLGDWVLCNAARYAAAHADMPGSRIAVNVSALQLRGQDIAGTVARVLRETGLPAASLELELTESAIVDEGERLIGDLAALRALGISVAIDDFGTGYSSLQYLKRLPVDRLKIDRAFVQGLDHDPDNHAIVATIAALANQFGLALTAEGVETEDEVAALLSLGCYSAQGYYYAAPELIDPPAGD